MAGIQVQTASKPEELTVAPCPRIPLETDVILKFAHYGGFFLEYSANISQSGVFIKTDYPSSPGSVFIFEIWLGDEFRLVHGVGEVIWVRHVARGSERPPGMGVRFLKIDRSSQEVIGRVVDEHLRLGGRLFDLTESAPPGVSSPGAKKSPDGYDTAEIESTDSGEISGAEVLIVPAVEGLEDETDSRRNRPLIAVRWLPWLVVAAAAAALMQLLRAGLLPL